jgi:hypothetical protein
MQDTHGGTIISGALRVVLPPGQESATAHVAFCPPLAQPPVIDLDLSEPVDARIKVAQALPHGARFEIKLAGGDLAAARQVQWTFTAHAG